MDSWRDYLEGCPSGAIVVMDHQPLIHYIDQPVLSQVQTRWMQLGLFQLISPTMKYQLGNANIIADAQSRSQCPIAKEPEQRQEAIAWEDVLLLSASLAKPQDDNL